MTPDKFPVGSLVEIDRGLFLILCVDMNHQTKWGLYGDYPVFMLNLDGEENSDWYSLKTSFYLLAKPNILPEDK